MFVYLMLCRVFRVVPTFVPSYAEFRKAVPSLVPSCAEFFNSCAEFFRVVPNFVPSSAEFLKAVLSFLELSRVLCRAVL